MNTSQEPITVYIINPESGLFHASGLVDPQEYNPECHVRVAPTDPPHPDLYSIFWNKHTNTWYHKLTETGAFVLWQQVKNERNRLLSQTDWTQMPDVVLSPEKKTAVNRFRQELRDITLKFTSPDEVVWPVNPLD